MISSRRSFFRQSARIAVSSGVLFPSLKPLTESYFTEIKRYQSAKSAEALAADEDFWAMIQQAYTVSPTTLNLNNGGVSPAPTLVQEAVERYFRYSNEAPSYYMWRVLDQGREPLREQLAKLAGTSPEEIAINRNATEALDTVILGLPLQRGDEVVVSNFDYPNMMSAWRQRELRDGLKLNYVKLPMPCEDENRMVKLFVEQMTPQTKVVHLTHVINWSGQVLPVRKIADEAHKRGIEVLVDGAHSFVHLDYKVPELGCDYFGTSLHKWLSAPIGTGMLWVKKEKISKVFPLVPNEQPQSDNIRKFENLGTRPFFIEQAIAQAIQFNNAIGSARKYERLFYLKNYWAEKVKDIPGIELYTSLKKGYSGALAVVGVEGLKPGELESQLLTRFKIHTTPIDKENVKGVRVTPHVYILPSDLDRLVNALTILAKESSGKLAKAGK
ncbi:aminotransferase class V-fold PLP-dependent enzyme [Siphonobacter sp. SORGH_AS_0500]|uniref:aminotransferase class V-fold PLP-dependent enzyme n=1 Tax=Siphonobacter sp. SORGH_AS_0500 TaxID=1864824 RepID=UPI00285E915B|nr:aminotransferase class V-fold PLP-dependent enzyme [Siphonobacter sp. SORGH_AS_0500]MDR6193631.1 selenocysteine lyase/cysteine desulfurase [Siphonobacter sp. SORGH_AS_0500]